jgi:DHA1 family bicyclomycin/chloramphenicol resistance-like MFS transporter
MSPRILVLYCGLLLSVTAFSIDITLPAFTLMAADLSAPYASVQLVIPVFLLMTGVGQFFSGPLSDRFGRRPVVLAGLAIYALGALVCMISPQIEYLLFGRAIQGLGASVGPVVARAILRDLFSGRELARNIALATMIFAVGPIVAPLLGVSIMLLGTWRLVFLVIMGFGTLLFLTGFFRLPETNKSPNPAAARPAIFWKNMQTVMRNDRSRLYVLMSGPILAMMLVILVAIPRVYHETFGIDGAMFALLFALHGLGIIFGQILNRRMITSLGTAPAMRVGATLLVLTVTAMVVIDLVGWMNAYVLSAILVVFAVGYLIVAANSAALALDPHGEIAGFVSSFLGFCSQIVGSVIAIILATVIGGDLTVFIIVLFFTCGFVLAMLVVFRESHEEID